METPLSAATRRQIIQRLSLLAAASGLPWSTQAEQAIAASAPVAWSTLDPKPIQAVGYGTDPNLVQPVAEPWPRTLNDAQLKLLDVLADILLPADGETPAASQVGVSTVVDHWVSAPYPLQQQHRSVVLAGFDWLQREAERRFNVAFVQATAPQQLGIIDDIAFELPPAGTPFHQPAQFFALLRRLVTGAYYSSPQGLKELGYQGNVPIAGDYPGPTQAAMQHLNKQLDRLGLHL